MSVISVCVGFGFRINFCLRTKKKEKKNEINHSMEKKKKEKNKWIKFLHMKRAPRSTRTNIHEKYKMTSNLESGTKTTQRAIIFVLVIMRLNFFFFLTKKKRKK